jgi:hypothetical protein
MFSGHSARWTGLLMTFGRRQQFLRWLAISVALLCIGRPGTAETVAHLRQQAVHAELPGLTVLLPGGGERHLTILELETLGTWQIRTTGPGFDGEILLEGPLLRDVLAHVGLVDAERIIVRSADTYAPELPRSDWRDFPVVLATRMHGTLLGRRYMGPTRIVYPNVDYPELASPDHQARSVWLITSIEVPGR